MAGNFFSDFATVTTGNTPSGYHSSFGMNPMGMLDAGFQNMVDKDVPILSWIGELFGYNKIEDHDIYNGASNEEILDDSMVYKNNDFTSFLEGLMASQGQEAIESRIYNRAEAERNRQFQERMSNTAYQRAVADLQKAGLNPILAAKVSGASTPSGSAGSHSSTGDTLSDLLKAFAALISSASDIGRMESILKVFK